MWPTVHARRVEAPWDMADILSKVREKNMTARDEISFAVGAHRWGRSAAVQYYAVISKDREINPLAPTP